MAVSAKTKNADQVRWPAWWGLIGVCTLFGNAVIRLMDRGITTIERGLTMGEWVALVALTALFVYGEGVRALQRKYLPHLLGRIRQLPNAGRTGRILAPLYAMTLVEAPRGHLVRAWSGVVAIVAAVILVSRFPEPWRGITDFAVAAALGWALLVLLAQGPAFITRIGQNA